jgi:hypothetical protein
MKRPEDEILLRDMVDHARRAERSWPIRSKTGCSSAFARATSGSAGKRPHPLPPPPRHVDHEVRGAHRESGRPGGIEPSFATRHADSLAVIRKQ